MANNTTVQDAPRTEELGLPNKFFYPEFAGRAGEDLLHDIVEAILPLGLYRTWETFERKHAYDNDCFQSLSTIAKKARRTQRTVNRNIATFMARGLLVLRSDYKFFRRSDGSTYKKAVVVKDFSGLYALAHEYYEWQYSEDYLAPEYEYVGHIQHDPRLQAKLCRFEDYRRMLEYQRDPFAQVQEDRRFTEYREDNDPDLSVEYRAEDAEVQPSGQNKTKIVSKELPNELSKVSKERINEKAYGNSLERDSFDSDGDLEKGGGADATPTSSTKSGARDYTKQVREYETGIKSNESKTNPVPPSPKNIPPGAGNTGANEENHPDVHSAQDAMAKTGLTPGQSARHQDKELPPPPKHPLARSFVQEISRLFGDMNIKGSKTGVERVIEGFELVQPADVLRCLVRAYIVARDTPDEKVRRRRPDGTPNRMPLFYKMFFGFAQSFGPGSDWQYTQARMMEDISADGRLEQWLSEHQAELAGEESSDHAETTEASPPAPSEAVEEDEEVGEGNEETGEMFTEEGEDASEGNVLPPARGWKTREDAYGWATYVLDELIKNGYGDLEVSVFLPPDIDRYQVRVQNADGVYYCLVCRDDMNAVVAMARNRTLFAPQEISDDQAVAGD